MLVLPVWSNTRETTIQSNEKLVFVFLLARTPEAVALEVGGAWRTSDSPAACSPARSQQTPAGPRTLDFTAWKLVDGVRRRRIQKKEREKEKKNYPHRLHIA
ncbi:hypothetical protein Q8A73_005008 [Channa argus]|nr:hypothetical protein Q8A73_005008 [Channa argus]